MELRRLTRPSGWPAMVTRSNVLTCREKPMKVKDARQAGKISTGNTKMPGTTFAIDAFACITGSKLAKIAGTPCASCYARRLQKIRPSVDQGWKDNLARWQSTPREQWVASMVFQIERYNVDGYHRWFDSGDLQNVAMLQAIVAVCNATPHIRHWLPTQERQILRDYKSMGGTIPHNLVVRVSGSKINGPAPNFANTSTVFDKRGNAIVWECRARHNNNSCGDCRACWNKSVANVSYPKH